MIDPPDPACVHGCDPRFLVFVTWKGESVRVGQGRYTAADGHRWSGMLRCTNCNDQLIVTNISKDQKTRLEEREAEAKEEMDEMLQSIDRESDIRHAEFAHYLKETGRA